MIGCGYADGFCRRLLPLLLFALPLFAQDELRVASPNGQVEFRIFLAPQNDSNLHRLAYEVHYGGKIAIEPSYLGLDIWEQEPILGENVGLMSQTTESKPLYHSLIARYMQNGSIGRRLDLEVRVYDNAVAFRYFLPKSISMAELLIADEATEFVVAPGSPARISEVPSPQYPKMHIVPEEGNIFLTRLERLAAKPALAFEGKTPLTTSWRVISLNQKPIALN